MGGWDAYVTGKHYTVWVHRTRGGGVGLVRVREQEQHCVVSALCFVMLRQGLHAV